MVAVGAAAPRTDQPRRWPRPLARSPACCSWMRCRLGNYSTLAPTIDERRPVDWAARSFRAHRPTSVSSSPTKPRYDAPAIARVGDTLLRCIIFFRRMSELGQNRPICSTLACLLSPAADMARDRSVGWSGRSTLLKCRPIPLDSASYQGLACHADHGEHLPASTSRRGVGLNRRRLRPPEAVQRLRSGGGKGRQPPAASYRAWRASARRGGGAWHDSTVRNSLARAGCSVG
jgi:hypothetical protein